MLDLSELPVAIRHEGCVSRRLFLAYAASLSAIPLLGRRAVGQTQPASFSADPFSLGVASGDPSPSGVVLWTRLAPKPLEPGGGLPPTEFDVSWEIARDESMRSVLQRGTALANPRLGHSVHVEVEGLEPDRWYWYRFRAGDAESPVGRTRTLPPTDSAPQELRFAFASCQNYQHGLYTAYEHMAQDELDLVFHLGDYIYENPGRDGSLRKHQGQETLSLDDYRIRHAQYKMDPHLQAIHAHCPWIVTWDDHEVQDNYANDISSQPGVDPAAFLVRRAGAYQAYYEMMPLRSTSIPHGPTMQLYRQFSYGRLAEFLVLDTRQYRTDQPNGDGEHDINDDAFSPSGTQLGADQRKWLGNCLKQSAATWNVLAQQVMMAMVDVRPGEKRRYDMDQWPGYAYERQQLMKFLEERRIPNPVVLSGDIHSNWVNDLRLDDRHPETPVIATEFVGTSISSDGDGADRPTDLDTLLAENPCVKYHNAERGYVRCTLTSKTWHSDYCTVPYVTRPGAPLNVRSTFALETGRPGAQQA
jgi:alkaline phosphatase D